MAKGENVPKWKNRIESAKEYRDSIAKRDRWEPITEEYKGNYKQTLGTMMGHAPIIPINGIYSYIQSIIPMLYYRDPHFAVSPTNRTSVFSAKLSEQVLNYRWKELEVKDDVELLLIECLLVGHSWFKLGYAGIFGEVEIDENTRRNEDVPKLEPNEYIRSEEVFVSWESWKNVLFDPASTKPLKDTRWLAHRIFRPTEALKKSDRYSNTAELEPDIFSSEIPDPIVDIKKKEQDKRKGDIPMNTLWEIWDRDMSKVYVMAENHRKFLLEVEWPYPFLDGFPFEMLKFNLIPGEPYPLSDILPWENQLFEKIKLRSLMLDHIKRFGRQIFSRKGNLSATEITKFQEGITGSVIQYTKEMPAPVPYPPIQTDIYAVDNGIRIDEDSISGLGNIIRGAAQKTQSRTLGEVERVIDFAQNRTAKKQDVLRNFLERVARKILQFEQEFTSVEKYAKIVGERPQEILQALAQEKPDQVTENGIFYTQEDIKGEFEVSTKIGSEIPMDKANRIEALNQSLKVAQSIGIDQGGETAKLIGKLLMRDYGMKEVELQLEREIEQLRQMNDITQKLQQGQQLIAQQEQQIAQQQQVLGEVQGGQGGNLPLQ